MKYSIIGCIICILVQATYEEEVRLINLDPQDAQQIIEQQDTSLNYAPKVESNVPAVRYLGNEPHNVVEDIYLAKQYHGQDGIGGYLYGYSVPDIAKTEKKKAGGDLRGAYNYIAGNGQEIKVEYWDDGTGFHQIDNVPKNLPEDLPEVKKAKEDFMRIWQEQAERNSRPVEDPYNSEGQYKEGPLSLQGQLHRQQQFASQFGAQPNNQIGAASQQKPIYQSNLERSPQTYNPNYQPIQGKDQQNQGFYQSKQYSPQGQNQGNPGQQQSGYGPSTNQGKWNQQSQGVPNYQNNQGGSQTPYGGKQGVNQKPSTPSGYQGNQGGYQTQYQGQQGSNQQSQTPSGYQGAQGGYQTQYQGQQGSHQQSQTPTGYQGTQGGYQTQYQGQQGSHQQSQTPSGYQGTQFQGQQSENVNKYAPQPQSSYGRNNVDNSYSGNPRGGQEDDGSYHEKDDEQQGPPKGFFYKFDYPVGIIVSKQGPTQGGGYQPPQNKPGTY